MEALMANDPWTGARLGADTDAPLGGSFIAESVNQLGTWTVPGFASTADRDAALAGWVANGNTVVDLMRCTVAGVGEQVRVSGVWVTVGGFTPYPAPFALLYGSGTQSVASGTATAIFLNSVQRQTNISVTASGGIIRATVAGWYLVSGAVTFPGSSGGTRRITSIMRNGVGIDESNSAVYTGGAIVNLWVPSAAIPVALNVNDYVQIAATQDTGSSITVDRTACFLQAHYIGPLTP
jgi:hypothetical protein